MSARSFAPAFLAVLLTAPVLAGLPNLDSLQSPELRDKHARTGRFRKVYRAIMETEDHQLELLGLRMLLGDRQAGIDSARVRERTAELGGGPEARRQALAEVAHWLEEHRGDPDFVERFFSYAGEEGKGYPDFLVFTTPVYQVACFYGAILFHISPRVPRGVDLNGFNKDLDRAGRRDWDEWMRSRNLMPLDWGEYVLPSHVDSSEVVAVEVRQQPVGFGPSKGQLPGRRYRTYVRKWSEVGTYLEVRGRTGLLRGYLAAEGFPFTGISHEGEALGRPLAPKLVNWLERQTVPGGKLRYHHPEGP